MLISILSFAYTNLPTFVALKITQRKKDMKKILKVLVSLVIAIIVVFGGLIAYAAISDYKPEEKILLSASEAPEALPDSAVLALMTWNIGYCGLDAGMDFFYDGGIKVRNTKEQMAENMKGVMSMLMHTGEMNFILLQEVDRRSKRTYKIDQYEVLTAHSGYASKLFATNYDVFFVPVPPATPMGKVWSGIVTLSKTEPSNSFRYSFPGEYGFPKQLFMLDRCFMVNRYPVKNGKELILINTHNEAFDPGQIRKAQMDYLHDFIVAEYSAGNYVIAGGDWNQTPPNFEPKFEENVVNTAQMSIPADYLPSDWNWLYDNRMPTNRSVTAKYDPATTTTTVIDFFLTSPNVETLSVNGVHLGFKNSDHNPVMVQVRLK
jgi:endonuclease/exonuclease/phosphatase family metal-dependent hydrolase